MTQEQRVFLPYFTLQESVPVSEFITYTSRAQVRVSSSNVQRRLTLNRPKFNP